MPKKHSAEFFLYNSYNQNSTICIIPLVILYLQTLNYTKYHEKLLLNINPIPSNYTTRLSPRSANHTRAALKLICFEFILYINWNIYLLYIYLYHLFQFLFFIFTNVKFL